MRKCLVVFFLMVALPLVGDCGCDPCACDPCECDSVYYVDDCCEYVDDCCDSCCWEWIPGGAPIYEQYFADPRWLGFSGAWRFDDRLLDDNIGAVSLGEQLGLLRINNPFGFCGVWQVNFDAGLWAVFKHIRESAPLVNADYLGGVSFEYAWNCWATRFRVYHISSHLGDEFLLNHAGFDRRNPSSEFAEFHLSYEGIENFRAFGAIGAIIHNDDDYPRDEAYFEYGFESVFPCFNYYHCPSQMNAQPFFSFYAKHAQEVDWDINMTIRTGYEFEKLCGNNEKIRLFFEYHHGFSAEGQFQQLRTEYYAIGAAYGY